MPSPTSTPKIDELRSRLKADPKSRLFYPLAEELRKVGRTDEAEQILRDGLAVHPSYVSAWVSLGRVLKEQGKLQEAVDVLTRASGFDAGNVVVARLLGESYLGLGDKLAAVKKLKLVHALMPADEELEAQIDRLDQELAGGSPIAVAPAGEAAPEAEVPIEEPPAEVLDDTRGLPTMSPPQPSVAAQHDVRDETLDRTNPQPFGDLWDTPEQPAPQGEDVFPGAVSQEPPVSLEAEESPFESRGEELSAQFEETEAAELTASQDDVFGEGDQEVESAPREAENESPFLDAGAMAESQAAETTGAGIADEGIRHRRIERLQSWLSAVKGGRNV